MELNVKEFMETEMGKALEETVWCWDKIMEEKRKTALETNKLGREFGLAFCETIYRSCQERWKVFRLALKQFYGIEFHFTRTDEYFGVCTEDESLWLMKEMR